MSRENRRPRGAERVLILLLGLLAAVPATGEGQVVRGSVSSATGGGLAGTLVIVRDSSGREIAKAITDPTGSYRLSIGRADAVHVRAMRIGFRPVDSRWLSLAEGEEVVLPPLVLRDAIVLDTVRVERASQCRADRGTQAAFTLWEQVRAAIGLTEVSAALPRREVKLVSYSRLLQPSTRNVLQQTFDARTDTVHQPWTATSSRRLRQDGYVTLGDDDWITYHAPAIGTLLEDEFVEDHCFSVTEDSSSGRIGLAFEPTAARRRFAEIRGVMWIDRATAELRRMEFSYVNSQQSIADGLAGGWMDFGRLANGGFVIAHWELTLPVVRMQYERASGIRSRARVAEPILQALRIVGGEVAAVTVDGDTAWRAPRRPISGVVVTSESGAAVEGALVRVRGDGLVARTDPTGVFRVEAPAPGEIVIELLTDTLAAIGASVAVPLTAVGNLENVVTRLPSARDLARRLCAGASSRGRPGMIVGRVMGTNAPIAFATVVADWDADGDSTARRGRSGLTDQQGRFKLCGLPTLPLQVRATSRWGNSASAAVEMRDGLALVDLSVDSSNGANATLTGVAVTDVDGQGVADVEVIVGGIDRATRTDSSGQFRIATLPPGSYPLTARKIGYSVVESGIALDPGATTELSLVMSTVDILSAVEVTADRYLTDFEHHRKMGFGKFITREDLEKIRGGHLSTLFQQTPGVAVVRGTGNHAWLAGARGPRSIGRGARGIDDADRIMGARDACYAHVYLDNMPIYRGKPPDPRRPAEPLFDINSIPPEAVEAIEFYSGPAQTPAKYATLNSECGVLVIHTRRTP